MTTSDLRIGRVAALAGVTVDTVRFYERRGLLPAARRERSGYRVFDETAVERLRLIRSLGELELGLDEIAAMLEALAAPGAHCAQERPRIASALARTEARLAELALVREKLRTALDRCDHGACTLPSHVRSVASRKKLRR